MVPHMLLMNNSNSNKMNKWKRIKLNCNQVVLNILGEVLVKQLELFQDLLMSPLVNLKERVINQQLLPLKVGKDSIFKEVRCKHKKLFHMNYSFNKSELKTNQNCKIKKHVKLSHNLCRRLIKKINTIVSSKWVQREVS